jgi:N utilization substance protein A
VEVGSEIRMYRDTSPLGRIAAQLAKQVIFQKVREAERDTVFQEYAHREKEVLNATVKRIEGQDIIYDLGKAEARCPKREQSRLEQFSIGERVRVVLLKVDRAAKGPQVIVSRRAGAGFEPVPVRGSGDLRQHRGHSRHCARSRRAHQDRRAAATRMWTRWAPAWA